MGPLYKPTIVIALVFFFLHIKGQYIHVNPRQHNTITRWDAASLNKTRYKINENEIKCRQRIKIINHDQSTVYEVTLDANGVAHRVPNGQGTHFIHVSEDSETHMEEKVSICFYRSLHVSLYLTITLLFLACD